MFQWCEIEFSEFCVTKSPTPNRSPTFRCQNLHNDDSWHEKRNLHQINVQTCARIAHTSFQFCTIGIQEFCMTRRMTKAMSFRLFLECMSDRPAEFPKKFEISLELQFNSSDIFSSIIVVDCTPQQNGYRAYAGAASFYFPLYCIQIHFSHTFICMNFFFKLRFWTWYTCSSKVIHPVMTWKIIIYFFIWGI